MSLTHDRVNGQDNGLTNGIRTAQSNNPSKPYNILPATHSSIDPTTVTNVNDNNIACNFGFKSPVSSQVINVKAGDKVGVNWGHVIGGPQMSNDADHPIAKSHKGPTMFYMYVSHRNSFATLSKHRTNRYQGQKWIMLLLLLPRAKNGSRSSKTVSMAPAPGASTA